MPSNAYHNSYYSPPPNQQDLNLSPSVVFSCVLAGVFLIYHALGSVLNLPTPFDLLLYMASHLFGPGARETLQANFTARNSAFSLRNMGSTLTGSGSGEGVVGGLWNVGNTCYQNSVLQALSSLPALKPYLVAIDEGDTANALQRLVDSLNTIQIGGRAETPAAAITRADGKGWGYNEQQDAQEFLQNLMTALEKEYVRVQKQRKEEKRVGLEGVLLPARNGPEITDEEDVPSPFEGLLAQRVGCLSCGYVEAIGMQPFTTLSLPIPRTILGDSTIEACLREFAGLEQITQVDCDKCTLLSYKAQLEKMLARDDTAEPLKQTITTRLSTINSALETDNFSVKVPGMNKSRKVSATKTKQVMISRAPKILALHTNRSVFDMHTGMIVKNYAKIEFPKTLDLGMVGVVTSHERLLIDPARNMSPPVEHGPQYELRSVVAHYGAHNNGHYITYRIWAGKWWKISDHEVFTSSEDEVLDAGNAFLLFYERVEDVRPEAEKSEAELLAEKIPAPPPTPLAKKSGLVTPPPELVEEIDMEDGGRVERLPTPDISDDEKVKVKDEEDNISEERSEKPANKMMTPPPDESHRCDTHAMDTELTRETSVPATAPVAESSAVLSPPMTPPGITKRKGQRQQQHTPSPVAVQ
ncbi:cysteine proteinase [Ascodesmis nigricans]|uniref:ubiquitinyl hydrolase 1 n=1 Tax=Ascodesmis nigricans TaxID=341454 RepID=A0A4S2N2F6_9PEZI|nr:cysteine proteinase [Ascodesmis nigricans]